MKQSQGFAVGISGRSPEAAPSACFQSEALHLPSCLASHRPTLQNGLRSLRCSANSSWCFLLKLVWLSAWLHPRLLIVLYDSTGIFEHLPASLGCSGSSDMLPGSWHMFLFVLLLQGCSFPCDLWCLESLQLLDTRLGVSVDQTLASASEQVARNPCTYFSSFSNVLPRWMIVNYIWKFFYPKCFWGVINSVDT